MKKRKKIIGRVVKYSSSDMAGFLALLGGGYAVFNYISKQYAVIHCVDVKSVPYQKILFFESIVSFWISFSFSMVFVLFCDMFFDSRFYSKLSHKLYTKLIFARSYKSTIKKLIVLLPYLISVCIVYMFFPDSALVFAGWLLLSVLLICASDDFFVAVAGLHVLNISAIAFSWNIYKVSSGWFTKFISSLQ